MSKKSTRYLAALKLKSTLVEKWPAVFSKDKPVPLAVGIHIEIAAALPDADVKVLGLALRLWTTRLNYLAAIQALCAVRRSLDGREQQPVTDLERSDAAAKAERIKAKLAEAKAGREQFKKQEERHAEKVAKPEAVKVEAKAEKARRPNRGTGPLAKMGLKGATSK